MKQIKRIVIPAAIALISFTSFSQETSKKDRKQQEPENMKVDSVYGHFLMVNCGDTSKQFKLRDAGAYILIYNEVVKDTITLEKIYYANGNIRDLHPTYLEFDIRNETIEHNFKDGSVMNTQNDYSSFYYSQHEAPRVINLKSLQYIDYSSPARSTFHAIGVSTMILSAVTALVAAPVLNVDFKHGGLNQSGYINTVKVGLVGLVVGFPISYFSRTKRYQVTSNQSIKDKDYWYIDKEK